LYHVDNHEDPPCCICVAMFMLKIVKVHTLQVQSLISQQKTDLSQCIHYSKMETCLSPCLPSHTDKKQNQHSFNSLKKEITIMHEDNSMFICTNNSKCPLPCLNSKILKLTYIRKTSNVANMEGYNISNRITQKKGKQKDYFPLCQGKSSQAIT